jgi:hypothetical protein
MVEISLSHLLELGDIDNPAATPMEHALMHALESCPKGGPDRVITAEDIAAFKTAFPSMGSKLDTNEQSAILDTFAVNSFGTLYETGNMALIVAARHALSEAADQPTQPYQLVTTESHYNSAVTATSLPTYQARAGDTALEIAQRVIADYPELAGADPRDIADKIARANGWNPNADGSYPKLEAGQTVMVTPYPDGAMDRVNALLEQVVSGLPDATKNMVLATLGIGVGIFLATLWLTPATATVAVMTYLAATLGEAFMVGAGVGLVTLLVGAAMGSNGLSSAYEIKNNPEVGKLGANMVMALAVPKAIETTTKAITAATPAVRNALLKIGDLLTPATPALEVVGTMDAGANILPAIRANTSLTLGMNNFPIVNGQIRTVYLKVLTAGGEEAWLPIVGTRQDIVNRLTYLRANPATGTDYRIFYTPEFNTQDWNILLSAGPGKTVYAASTDNVGLGLGKAFGEAAPYVPPTPAAAQNPFQSWEGFWPVSSDLLSQEEQVHLGVYNSLYKSIKKERGQGRLTYDMRQVLVKIRADVRTILKSYIDRCDELGLTVERKLQGLPNTIGDRNDMRDMCRELDVFKSDWTPR